MPLQALVRWFRPKEDKFFGPLEQLAAVLAEAAAIMARLTPRDAGAGTVLEQVHDLEHRGDELTRAVTLALQQTFVTPIDREDLHTLASQLDDVLDYLYAAAQAFVMYDVQERTQAMEQMTGLLAESTAVLRDALPNMRLRRFDRIAPARMNIIAIEKRGDDVYRAEMAALYRDPAVDGKELLRQQSVLGALEDALDRCQDAADLLENIAVKHA